ncbi:MAG: hypothetical protein ACYC6G_03965 [Desulfobaccales bacterium]
MRVYISIGLGIPFLICLFLAAPPQIKSCAAQDTGRQQLTEPETWVLGQIAQGQEADLKKRFGADDKKRLLTAGFLEKLLVGGFKTVRVPHQGVKITHAIIDDPLNLEYAEVDYLLSLSHCLFKKPVTFQETSFKKDLAFTGSVFLNTANFKGVKVEGSLFCNDVLFEREGLWCDAKIGKNFHAQRVEFRSNAGRADFNGMNVESSAFFTSAKFYGPVDFGIVHIGRQFNINKAEFFHAKETVNFISFKVDQIAYFKGVRFHGPVDFAIAQIGIQFNADAAEFLNPDKLANFSGIKVGNTIYFQGAQFHGPAKFEFAEIGVNFRATGAGLLNACQAKNLSKMKVGHKVFLNGAIILCNLDMSYGEFYDLEINGSRKDIDAESPSCINLPLITLKGTVVQRDLKIANVRIGELDASCMQVKGLTLFDNVEIDTLADFRNSAFQNIYFTKVKWPATDKIKKTRKLYLGELTYSSINIDKQGGGDLTQDDFRKVKELIGASPFNSQTYVQLEGFFKRIGKESWANQIFILMRDRELSEKMRWWDPRRWLEWFFWGVLAGYGRAPFRVFFISMVLIILGAILYDPEHLQPRDPPRGRKTSRSIILRFFISLDRFLPVELGLGKKWDASATNFFIWLYFHLELILGWILIPIALASIYTQIK